MTNTEETRLLKDIHSIADSLNNIFKTMKSIEQKLRLRKTEEDRNEDDLK